MKKILVYSHLWFPVHTQLELYLGTVLEYTGDYEVIIVLCDPSNLEIARDCERLWNVSRLDYDESKRSAELCSTCNSTVRDVFEKWEFSCVSFKEIESTNRFTLELVSLIRESTWQKRVESYKSILDYFGINSGYLEEYDNIILSSLYTRTRTSDIDSLIKCMQHGSQEPVTYIDNALKLFFYGLVVALQSEIAFKEVAFGMTFSGRFNPSAGILHAYKLIERPLIVHERGQQKGTFSLAINSPPSDLFVNYRRWLDRNDNYRLNEADSKALYNYLESKIIGRNQNGYSYSDKTTEKVGDVTNKKYICYFTSSSDELVSFNRLYSYKNQIKEIKALGKWCKKNKCLLVVRHHPNLGRVGRPNAAYKFLSDVNSLANRYMLILPPTHKVNSYLLAYKSVVAVAPQSTLSLDLALLGMNLLQSENSPYKDLFPRCIDFAKLQEYDEGELVEISGVTTSDILRLENIAWKHYCGTSWMFEGVRVEGFKSCIETRLGLVQKLKEKTGNYHELVATLLTEKEDVTPRLLEAAMDSCESDPTMRDCGVLFKGHPDVK